MLNVIIIEDEKPAARRLQRLLNDLGIEVQTLLHSVKESIQWLSNNPHPDLIMLDIQLSDGISFEIFEALQIKSAVIFTTAYDEYALKAFKLNSIDYLLKPIDDEELSTAINKYKSNTNHISGVPLDLEQIRNLLTNPLDRQFKKRYTIKVGQHLKVVNTSDVVCFYSENKSTYLATNEGRVYHLDQSLEVVEGQVDPNKFYRVSRRYLVQINGIEDIIAYTNSRLRLKLRAFKQDDVIVSREKVKDFKLWLE